MNVPLQKKETSVRLNDARSDRDGGTESRPRSVSYRRPWVALSSRSGSRCLLVAN